MKFSLIPAAGLAMLAAAPAIAGGAAEPPAPPVMIDPVPVASGMDWSGPSVGVQLGYGDLSTSGAATLSDEGAVFGLRAYYDYDFGDFILGGGLQYDASDIDLGGIELDSVTRVGIRGGLDLGRNWIYGTAGWAQAQTSLPAIGDSAGWFAGIGYEVMMTDTISIGTEVLYHAFDEFNLVGLEAEATTAAVSVNFRF